MNTENKNLFNNFASKAAISLQHISSLIGPACPTVAYVSKTNMNEISIRRAEFQDSDELVEKLFCSCFSSCDGNRLFRAFCFAFVIEMCENRTIRGLILPSSVSHSALAARGKISRILRGGSSFRQSISSALEKVKQELNLLPCERKEEQKQQQQKQHSSFLLLLQACKSILFVDTSQNSELASIAASIAFSLSSSSSQYNNNQFVQLSGLAVNQSRILSSGKALLPVSTGLTNFYRLVLERLHQQQQQQQQQQKEQKNRLLILLVKKFDFVNFGSEENETNQDLQENRRDVELSRKRDQEELYSELSLTEIVQSYRQNISLSNSVMMSEKKRRNKKVKNRKQEQERDWLFELERFCCSSSAFPFTQQQQRELQEEEEEEDEEGNNNKNVLILTSHVLPEAAHKFFYPANSSSCSVSIIDSIDASILQSFENVSGATSATIPFRADESDTRNSFVEFESFNEVQLPSCCSIVSSSSSSSSSSFSPFAASSALFEFSGLKKKVFPKREKDQEGEQMERENSSKVALICGPTASVSQQVKKLVLKVSDCLHCQKLQETEEQENVNIQFVKGGFSPFLSLSRHLTAQDLQPQEQEEEEEENEIIVKKLISCMANASLNLVRSIASSSPKSRHHHETVKTLLRRPETVFALEWHEVSGKWKQQQQKLKQEEEEKEVKYDVGIVEFSWILPSVVNSAIDFVATLLSCDEVLS